MMAAPKRFVAAVRNVVEARQKRRWLLALGGLTWKDELAAEIAEMTLRLEIQEKHQ